MTLYRDSKAKIFHGDKTLMEESDCHVRIEGDDIEVRYDDDDWGGEVVYVGKDIGQGHFELSAPITGGEASLHRIPNSKILEGWWHESGYEGMWRITLSDGT